MSTPTTDRTTEHVVPTPTTGTTVVLRGRGYLVLPLLAALLGAGLAAGIAWLIVSSVSLDITPAAIGM
ncbi:hypothetical protein [Longivirga aurantiaca]|uniref:Uncharacterized protein n=1 Tax=Longivirga aurantiaca TaxID=1837743 RepID=A0ABW1T1R2_9ACTN